MEHEKLPPLCAQLLAELARRDDPTPIAELPERLREKAVLSGCERRGLAVGVVWYEGSPGSSGVLAGGTPYVAVGTSPGWYPSAALAHRPPSTHCALTAKGKEWLEEEQLRTGPHGGDLLQDAVADLLRRVPERWAEYDADALTATESQALFLLVAAGMVERRIRLRARLHNHPVAVEATITATGEDGFVEAMEPVLATMWAAWKDAYHAWRTGETRGAPLSVTEHLKPDEWRLTDQGALARADLDGGHAERALDFVLRRGFFDGQPRLILEPGRERVSQRGPVRGYGQLVTMRKVQADAASPPAVNVGNWKEGADAFAAAFEPVVKAVFEAKAAAEGLVVPDKIPAAPNAPTHSPDFTSVDWFGTRYTFAKGNQAESVRVLWDAWESGGHSLSQETISDRIGSAANRFELAKVFRRKAAGGGYEPHPAWGTMIRPDSKGSYRLTPPEST